MNIWYVSFCPLIDYLFPPQKKIPKGRADACFLLLSQRPRWQSYFQSMYIKVKMVTVHSTSRELNKEADDARQI
jgi:hypothetical protein